MRHAILIPAALAACAPLPPTDASPQPGVYRAVGTEPFWSVTLADGRMRYDDPSGLRIEMPAPAALPLAGGRRYVSDRLTLDVTHAPCSDGMSDRRYPDTVRAVVDGRELKGCGMPGEADAGADRLEGREWRVSAIAGGAPGGPRPAILRFAEGRIGGTTGCNRLMGGYAVEGDRLTLEGVGTTRMACPGAAMQQESAIVAALREPLRIVRGKDGVMLTGAEGMSLTLVPVRP